MTNPLQERIEIAMAELEIQRAKIRDLEKSMATTTATAQSENRMVTATVDRAGKLTELRFEGKRYRTIAPAELASIVVETVQSAQSQVSQQAMAMASSLLPPGLDVFGAGLSPDGAARSAADTGGSTAKGSPASGQAGNVEPPPIDLDRMLSAAMELLDVPLLQDQMRTERAEDPR